MLTTNTPLLCYGKGAGMLAVANTVPMRNMG